MTGPAEVYAPTCLWANCDRPATHEGYCEAHRGLSEAERVAMAHLQAMDELRKAARRAVGTMKREAQRKADRSRRSARRIRKASQRRNR